MNYIKLQIGCLSVLLYLAIMYLKETHSGKRICNRIYELLLITSLLGILFDGMTAWTVNHLDLVPGWLNLALHLGFFLSMEIALMMASAYICDSLIGLNRSKIGTTILVAPGIVASIIAICKIGSLEYLKGTITNYSMGTSVYACFITVAFYYVFIILMIIGHHNHLPKEKRLGTVSFLAIVGVILVSQIIFPELLVTAICTTIMNLGIYIVFENPAIKKLEAQSEQMVDSFATLVESRDSSTGGHIKRTRMYVTLLLNKMQRDSYYRSIMTRDYMNAIIEAAPLHDIGKISTPDDILKKPGKLTNEEYETMKNHAPNGGEIIKNTFVDMSTPEAKKVAYEVARHHHEKYNGKGYPDGLAGEEIPLHARVMSIADVFDAVSQDRCYRGALPLDECFSIIEKGSGTDFDPRLVKLFLDAREDVTRLCRG